MTLPCLSSEDNIHLLNEFVKGLLSGRNDDVYIIISVSREENRKGINLFPRLYTRVLPISSQGLREFPENKLPKKMPPFVLSLSKHRQPFDKLRANGTQFWVDYFKKVPYKKELSNSFINYLTALLSAD